MKHINNMEKHQKQPSHLMNLKDQKKSWGQSLELFDLQLANL